MVFSTLQSVGNTLQNWGVSALMGVVRTGSSLISGTVEGAPKVVAGATKTHPLLGAAQRAPVVGRALRQQVDDVSDLVRELRVSEYIDSGLDTFERRVRPTAPSFGERLAEGVGSGLATLPFFYNIGTALPTINALATRAGVDAYWRAKEGGKSDQEAEEIEQKVYLQEVPNQAADAFITRGLVLGKGMLSSVKALRPLQGIAKSRGPVANVALAAAGESGTEVLQTLVSHTIAEQAQVGEWFDPWEAVDAVMQEPGLQEELVLAGLSAALVGGGVRGGIEYGKAKMSPMSRAASTALFNDLQPLMPSGATAEALNDLTETERTNALSVAVFRAIDRKNPLIPDQAIARAVERHGRGRNVDSVVAAMADNEQSFRTEEFGVALLPTYNEVALELVRMDAMGEKNMARREALIAEQEAAVAASPERRAQALATELAQKLPSFKRAQEEGRVAFVEGLIDGIARGKYQEGVISLSDTASVGTIAHEAWHDFYQLGMTADEQQRFRRDLTKRHGAMIEEQMQRHGIGRDEAELEVGAILAEQFVAEQRAPKTFLERMFDALRGFVADVVGPQSEVWDALERFGGADAQERFYTSGLRSPVLAGLSDGLYQRADEMLPMQVVREGAKIENELGRTSIKYKNPVANIVEVQTNAALTTGDLLGEKHYSPSTRDWDVFGWWVSSDAGDKYFISEVQSDFIVEAALRESDEEMESDWGEDQDFVDASKKQWAETILRRAAEDARAEGHTKIYIANEETAGVLQFDKGEDRTAVERSIIQKYSRRGVIIRSAKRLFGDAVDAEIDGHGVFEFDIQGDEGALYQRGGEIDVDPGVYDEDGSGA